MIKLKDITYKYGEYIIDEEKLREILIGTESIFNLKDSDKYYYLTSYGEILCNTWGNVKTDRRRFEIGNVFLTEESAEFEAERRKVEIEMLKYGGTRDMMSLGGVGVKKWGIAYGHTVDTLFIRDACSMCYQGTIYFKSEEDALNAINKIGKDKIIKYIFNVEER